MSAVGREVAEMRPLRCMIGRHEWQVRRNPEKGGPGAQYETCARCGKDRSDHEPSPGTGVGIGGAPG
jgi:hypothetical protein